MTNANPTFQLYADFYPEVLLNVRGITFTPRHIDIIACLINGEKDNRIGQLLSIREGTVETHKSNIRHEIQKKSHEDIIRFTQKSSNIHLIRDHYQRLLYKFDVERELKNLAVLSKRKNLICCIKPDAANKERLKTNSSFIRLLCQHLTLVGITIVGDETVSDTNTWTLHLDDDVTEVPQNHIFLLYKISTTSSEEGLNVIDFRDPQHYFSSLLRLLQTFFSDSDLVNLNALISEGNDPNRNFYSNDLSASPTYKILHLTQKIHLNKRITYIVGSLCITALIIVGFYNFKNKNESFLIRSDLTIPIEASFLPRPTLLSQINNALEHQTKTQKIATLGIVGMGGVGKTTLAKHYARRHPTPIMYEINAETKNSLTQSFKNLAYAFAKTKEQKDELEFIQKIQDTEDRDNQILNFVRSCLKSHPNWLLIYDNVEVFSMIRKYLPQDHDIWGFGKVIITTRNMNLKNSHLIKPENIIYISELSKTEKLTLFSQILYNSDEEKLTQTQKEKTLKFLESIPPFPLDISLAAHYIKSTNISLEEYLERIKYYSSEFDKIQKKFLKESSDYTKTRYGIITSSLQKIISIKPEFKELLLFISLGDSQNITSTILNTFQNDFIVEGFIQNLKKEGLITHGSILGKNDSEQSFSIHRSTQEISLIFLNNLLSDTEKKFLLEKLTSAMSSYHEAYSGKNYNKIISLIPHLEAFIKNLDLITKEETLKAKYKQRLLYILGYSHYHSSRNLILAKDAFSFIKQLEEKQPYLSPEQLAIMLNHLGDIYSNINELDKAISTCQQSFEICKKIPNSEGIITENLKTIGYAYYLKNDFDNAKIYLTKALEEVEKIKNKETRYDLEAPIYAHLGTLYSARYFTGEKAKLAENYLDKALQNFKATHMLYGTQSNNKISCNVARLKTILGQIYVRSGEYQKAIESGFREAEYIINHSLDNCSHHLLKARIAEGFGACDLRKGDVANAEKKFSESIVISGSLVGDSGLAIALRAEARIRLHKFSEAYEDCETIMKHYYSEKNIQNPYTQLIYITVFYHAAFIKYKEGDLKKSAEYFSDFFKNINPLCKLLLNEKTYKKLDEKHIFIDLKQVSNPTRETIVKCFQNSILIFSALYGSTHPFVKDYISVNYENVKDRLI